MLRSMFSSAVGQVVLGTPCDNTTRVIEGMSSPYPEAMMTVRTALKVFKQRYYQARRCSSLVRGRSSCIAEGAAHWP